MGFNLSTINPITQFAKNPLTPWRSVAGAMQDYEPVTRWFNKTPQRQQMLQTGLTVGGGAIGSMFGPIGTGVGAAAGAHAGKTLTGGEEEDALKAAVIAGALGYGGGQLAKGYGGGQQSGYNAPSGEAGMYSGTAAPPATTGRTVEMYELGHPDYYGYGNQPTPQPTPTIQPTQAPRAGGTGEISGRPMIAPYPGTTPPPQTTAPEANMYPAEATRSQYMAPSSGQGYGGRGYSANPYQSPSMGGGGFGYRQAPTYGRSYTQGNQGGWMDRNTPQMVLMGSQLMGSYLQAKEAEELAEKEKQSYDEYLATINPPEEVQKERFAGQKAGILKQAPGMRSRLRGQMAAKGIRGRGTASPTAAGEQATQDAINQAYFNVYGQYNIPSGPGPVQYSPSAGSLAGKNVSDIASWWAMNKMYGNQKLQNQKEYDAYMQKSQYGY